MTPAPVRAGESWRLCYVFMHLSAWNRIVQSTAFRWDMQAGRIERNDISSLPPFPEGWYFVASRQSILKARLIQKTWMGEEIVTWCDGDGRICVAEATCPHLGSNLGPAAGGRVRNGRLVCPFHGFEYDATGQCVATPFAPAPRSAKLTVFETREMLGLVFAWWGIGGRPPRWGLPEEYRRGDGRGDGRGEGGNPLALDRTRTRVSGRGACQGRFARHEDDDEGECTSPLDFRSRSCQRSNDRSSSASSSPRVRRTSTMTAEASR